MNTKLGGCLIGYGLKKKNGEFTKVIFDKPIHNTITKHCLNNLLMFNGDNTLPTGNFHGNWCSLFIESSQAKNRYGVFNSCALGNGTGTTAIADTELKNKIGDYTSTKKTGTGWCSTYFDFNNAIIKLRISHIHTISEDFTIKEIGWFNRIYPDGAYSLSARVQLDNFIDVESGDEFYSIYELSVSFQDVERFSDLFGLGGGYKVNFVNVLESSYQNDIKINYIPGILNTGYSGSTSIFNNESYCRPVVKPVYMAKLGVPYQTTSLLHTLTTNFEKWKPFISRTNFTTVQNQSQTDINVHDYVLDSYYRDCDFVQIFNNLTVYSIIVNGTMYRFGDFDASDNFTPRQVTLNGGYKFKYRQSWSTDLLTPSA